VEFQRYRDGGGRVGGREGGRRRRRSLWGKSVKGQITRERDRRERRREHPQPTFCTTTTEVQLSNYKATIDYNVASNNK
jgi:hypothetical protein